ncbi:hypothetical protein Agub_g4947, partial [Astrephomene gubernaculifera]
MLLLILQLLYILGSLKSFGHAQAAPLLQLRRGLVEVSSTAFENDVFVNRTCIAGSLYPLFSGCSNVDSSGNSVDYSQLRVTTSAMLQACVQFGGDPSIRRLRVLAGTARLYPELQRLGSAFTSASGIPLYFNFSARVGANGAVMRAAIARPAPVVDTADASGGMDAIITSPSFMHYMDKAGKLLDLSPLVTDDLQLQWFLINKGLREQMVVYGNKVVGIPVTTAPGFLFYHAPTFARDGLEVPVTWDQVLALAEAYNGKDINGDGVPDYGICLTPPNCFVDGTILLWVFASYVQTHGSSQGSLLDPLTGAQLANSSAMAAALEVMRRMRKAGPLTGDCSVFEDPLFLEGRCLLSLTSPITFKTAYAPDAPAVYASMRGAMGIAAFPGSTKVLNRTDGKLVNCSQDTCPMATAWTRDETGVLRPVNQPAPSTNVIVMINAQSPVQYQYYAYSLFSYLTSAKVLGTDGAALLLNPKLETAPLRSSDLTAESASRWVSAGYHPRDVTAFFTAYRAAMSNPNQVVEPKFPGNINISTACTLALLLYTNATTGYRTPPVSIPMSMISNTLAAVIAEEGGPVAFLEEYRKDLSWVPPPPPLAPSPPPLPPYRIDDGSDKLRRRRTLAAGVTCSVAVLVAAAAAAAVAVRRQRRRRRREREEAPSAPQAGPETTLLVTDIQSSTSLWEQLDPEVMNRALSIHHTIMRKCIAEWRGYESATEGDSFIVAFHNPTDALMCALEAQQALLSAPWPPELLQPPSLVLAEGEENPLGVVTVVPTAPAAAPQTRPTPRILQRSCTSQGGTLGSGTKQASRISLTPPYRMLASPAAGASGAAAPASGSASGTSATLAIAGDVCGVVQEAAASNAAVMAPAVSLTSPAERGFASGPLWRIPDTLATAKKDAESPALVTEEVGTALGEGEDDCGQDTLVDEVPAASPPPTLISPSPSCQTPATLTAPKLNLMQRKRKEPGSRTHSFTQGPRSSSSFSSAVSAVLGLVGTAIAGRAAAAATAEGLSGGGDSMSYSNAEGENEAREPLPGTVASDGNNKSRDGHLYTGWDQTSGESWRSRMSTKTLAASILATIRIIRGGSGANNASGAEEEQSPNDTFQFGNVTRANSNVTSLDGHFATLQSNQSGFPSSPRTKPPSLASTPIFQGLRVRMGMWTGVPSAADVTTNAASGRTQ